MILLKNGTIFDCDTGSYIDKDILIGDKKILQVSSNIDIHDSKIQVIDVKEKIICPGFIDAHSHIGMWTLTEKGNDANECVEPMTPTMKAIDAVNPMDTAFKDAYASGITTVMVCPGSGNAVGGQGAIIKTWGEDVEEMIVKSPAAMKMAFGENPKNVYSAQGKSPSSRMATASLIKELLTKAYMYFKEKKEGNAADYDAKLEAFIPVFEGKMPLKIHAHRADDISMAVKIAEKFNLKATLDHCTEGYLIKDYLKNKDFPVMIGPLFSFRSKDELKNASAKCAGILRDSGMLVSLISDHPFTNCKYLPLYAGLLSKYGFSQEEALKALTINPARALGIDDRIGSIEEGKDADLVIFDNEPLESLTNVVMTIINGIIVYEG
ncbi:amidohydrolase [Maledivibacter halophilus]|uniref:Imidazolonepropionase n=1 Tax=Maledivibacter halophilus TaxID=36842 RepID=A0A1T5KPR5_9FIRM|nr:amidohydrolase [Maledivibacter halophilus]SKC65722.1 Imidazolonepropionase [Maledivibacter halophilus]